jgi:tripartite-type tricarboxylate transporter receptor subunit TctC
MNRPGRLAILLALALVLPGAYGQAYPAKPLRMISPFPPGALGDLFGRPLNDQLARAWGQPIVLESRPGANGLIGMEACSKSANDGYTICFPDGNVLALNPFAYSRLPYDPLEFVPVIHFAELEQSFLVKASLPVNSMKELLDYARSRPGQVNWGSAGAGSTMHVYLAWLEARTGVKFNHIPYNGPAALIQAMAANQMDATVLTTAIGAPWVKSGKLKQIATVVAKERTPFAGDTPTFAQQGFDLDFRNWLALLFPKGTRREFVMRWNTEVNRVLADRSFVEKVLFAQGTIPTGGTPEELAAIIDAKRRQGAELARIANLKYD